jgi:hypothetical protein
MVALTVDRSTCVGVRESTNVSEQLLTQHAPTPSIRIKRDTGKYPPYLVLGFAAKSILKRAADQAQKVLSLPVFVTNWLRSCKTTQ